jgi:hypothetical protein
MFEDFFSYQKSRPRYLLNGELSSEEIYPIGKVFYERFTKKKYVITGSEFSVKNCIFNVELAEVGIAQFDPTTGEFNDDFDIINEFA